MDYIKGKFSIIEDYRHAGYIKHKLSDILTIIMCAVLCGLDDLCEISTYAEGKSEFFKKNFGIERIPSKPTFCRVLNMLDSAQVAKVIIEIMLEKAEFLGDVIAVDGKAIRSTDKGGKGHSALQILTAYLTESGVVLGQEAISKKTNEIPVFQEMLDFIDVKGKTITADAMHCQKKTCEKIVEKGGNYIFGLKGNQKNFYEDIALFFGDLINKSSLETFESIEKNKGRIEQRICKKTTDISWLEHTSSWAGIKTVFSVRRIITKGEHISDETNFYISSLNATPKELLKISRQHWKVESLHWLLDVTFSEDDCKILSENGHKTLNALRKLALFANKEFLKNQPKKTSIKGNLLKCLIDENILLHVIKNL